MTTLPVDLGWLIVAVLILTPALCFLATVEANHFYTKAYRKDMKAREKALNDRAVKVLEREDAVTIAEWEVAERLESCRLFEAERVKAYRLFEQDLHEQGLKLGRAAHNAATQARAALYQANTDDTQIAMPKLEA